MRLINDSESDSCRKIVNLYAVNINFDYDLFAQDKGDDDEVQIV